MKASAGACTPSPRTPSTSRGWRRSRAPAPWTSASGATETPWSASTGSPSPSTSGTCSPETVRATATLSTQPPARTLSILQHLSKLWLSLPGDDNDYVQWLAHSDDISDPNDGCMLGYKEKFLRLRKDSVCWNGRDYQVNTQPTPCPCTLDDFLWWESHCIQADLAAAAWNNQNKYDTMR